MADENTLKRINEILKEGIEATGIDADPSANNYATDYPTEHGDLIRELEDIGTLDELQDLVGGEKELENLITDIVNKQVEVSPRYLKSTPPLNEYGEEFGARGAYGITTEELLQPQIQDVIKQNLGIDTPTNVVDDIANYIEDYEELAKMQKNLDKNITGELPVEQVAYMYDEALLERGNISYEDFHNNYPEELGKVSRYHNKTFNKEYITFEDFYNELTDGYQLKENVTPEQFKNSLENFINEIENPRLQEGIQTKYSKYNNFIENIVDTKVKDRITTLVNQDIFTDIIIYNEYLYTLDTNIDIETGFFDYEEPTPVEDAFLADREGWDVDKEVKPETPNVGTYEGRLNSYYELALEDDAKFNNYRNTPTNVVGDINKIGTLDYPNQWHNTPTVKLVEAISENNLDIFVKNSKGEFVKLQLDDTARIGENAIQNSPKFDEGKSAIYSAIEELGDVDNPRYKLDLYSSNPDELAKLENALSNVNFDPFVKPEGTSFQLLSDTPTNVASSYHYNVEMVKGFPINQNPENFWSNPSDAIFGQQYKIDEFIDELIRYNAPIKNHPIMQELIKMMPNIDPNAGAATLIQNLDDRPTNPFGVFSDKRDFTNKIGESLYTRYTVRNYFNNTDTLDFIENTLIPALENKTLSKFDDVNRTNLSKFIYYLHHFETSGAFDEYDSKADIIKKVIYGDVPVMETGVDFNTNAINQEIDLLNIAGVDKTVVDLVVDNQIEIKNIMQTHLAKLQNPYLPDTDYIVVFRAGELGVHGGATPISSASKSYNVSEGMLFYQSSMGRNAGEADPKVKAYLVNTAEIIDTEALGIRGGIDGNEMEILAPDSAFIELDESTLEKIMQGDTIDEDIAKIVPKPKGGTVGAARVNDPRFGSKDVSEYVTGEGRNKWMELVDEAPEVFEDIYKASKKLVGRGLSALQVFDPGDIVIVESLRRLAPRLGLASIASPLLPAYIAYEVGVLLKDVGQSLNKARVNQGLGTVAEAGGAIFGGTENADWRKLGKDTFKQFGQVSDDWSLSWKISEPIINYVFEEYTELKNKREEQDYISNIETGVSPR
mgnify:FL=1